MSNNFDTHTVSGSEHVLDTFIAALQANVPPNAVVLVGGVSYTQADLVKKAQDERAFFKALRSAKEAAKKATADLRSARPGIKSFLKNAKIGMKAYLGAENPDIEKYGFHFDRQGELTTEALAVRSDKARRTREARHTMGARQKQAIHAPDVSDVVIHNGGAEGPDPKGATPPTGGAGSTH